MLLYLFLLKIVRTICLYGKLEIHVMEKSRVMSGWGLIIGIQFVSTQLRMHQFEF